LNSLRAELAKQENGRDVGKNEAENGEQHAAGLENIKILRDVKYYQMLYELLAKQYEIARLDEAKDSSIIQILDRAVQPERKFKPKRALIVLFATFMSFAAAIFLSFFIENRRAMLASQEGAERWNELKKQFRSR